MGRDECIVILRKYEISTDGIDGYYTGYPLIRALTDVVPAATPSQVWDLAQELARTRQSIRHGINPRTLFDERWDDFTLCMRLDGIGLAVDDYGREIGPFVPIEPTIEGAHPVEDDLSRELRLSQLSGGDEILRLIDDSAIAFLGGDNNGCLNNARVALETTGKSIGRELLPPGSTLSSKWGEVLIALREAGLISQDQEKGLAGVYRFVSPGSHVPVGFTESEFARLGRTLALSCTYFLVKKWNGTRRRDS
ncbi:hypothetical protein [Rhizobium laguerreae]|uniref:hypothetical protein n=1 Tax=Rhizobium laguerreae TaxID=1076926 RepID=UPI001C915BF7|nr:hypothetical protein [Rhizobium laguerreae]MBY3321233.1 hypothetical protein [Rhizobium laguerreae]